MYGENKRTKGTWSFTLNIGCLQKETIQMNYKAQLKWWVTFIEDLNTSFSFQRQCLADK